MGVLKNIALVGAGVAGALAINYLACTKNPGLDQADVFYDNTPGKNQFVIRQKRSWFDRGNLEQKLYEANKHLQDKYKELKDDLSKYRKERCPR